MKRITQMARYLTPAAMVVFLTMEIVKSQTDAAGYWIYLIAAAAFATSVGIELWGIAAGKNLELAWQINRSKWITAVQLVLYIGVTMWLMRFNPTLVVLPLVAALVYVATAMTDSLEAAVNQQQTTEVKRFDYDLERQRADDEHRRQMEAKQAEIQAANELQLALARESKQAEIAIEQERTKVEKTRINAQKTAAKNGHIIDTSDTSTKTDWRLLSDTERLRLLDLTPVEIEKQYGVSNKTAARWLDRAGQLSGHLSANGHAK